MVYRFGSVFICLLLSCAAFSQHTRIYKEGDRFRYRLSTQSFRNNQPDAKSVAVSQHTVLRQAGQLTEEIKWLSKVTYSRNDTLLLDSIARQVLPYHISLVPGGKLQLPQLTIPEMTGEITDLHTFFVAVSPALHSHLAINKDVPLLDSVLHGNFADGRQILRGEDCIQVTHRLLKRNKKVIVIETAFTPLMRQCIQPYIDTIGKSSFASPNNFQMVRKGTGNKVNLLWGVEDFTIISTIDRQTGQILEADMTNRLNLRMRLNATDDLKTYDAEFPVTIRRELHLELIRE